MAEPSAPTLSALALESAAEAAPEPLAPTFLPIPSLAPSGNAQFFMICTPMSTLTAWEFGQPALALAPTAPPLEQPLMAVEEDGGYDGHLETQMPEKEAFWQGPTSSHSHHSTTIQTLCALYKRLRCNHPSLVEC